MKTLQRRRVAGRLYLGEMLIYGAFAGIWPGIGDHFDWPWWLAMLPLIPVLLLYVLALTLMAAFAAEEAYTTVRKKLVRAAPAETEGPPPVALSHAEPPNAEETRGLSRAGCSRPGADRPA